MLPRNSKPSFKITIKSSLPDGATHLGCRMDSHMPPPLPASLEALSGMAAATKLLLQAHATCLLSLDATAKSSAPFAKPVLSLLQNLHCKTTWCKLAGRQTAIAIVQNLPRSCIKPPSSDVPLTSSLFAHDSPYLALVQLFVNATASIT